MTAAATTIARDLCRDPIQELSGVARLAAPAVFCIALLLASSPLSAQTAPPANQREVPVEQPMGGNVPGGHLGTSSDAEIWRAVRQGLRGEVTIPNRQAGQMIQSEGDNWRAFRNGPMTVAGGWIILGMIGLLALFFLLRGRIRIEAGASGRVIERFGNLERATHWLTAVSFVILALTGLNLLYGRHVLLPVLGPSVFSAITLAGKYAHNYLAFAFMIGLVLMFVLWIRHNLPNRYDMVWLAYGGGMFGKGVHPPARKFNLGQKVIFWAVILGGLSISLSGLALLFPFTFAFFEGTFEALNLIGIRAPTGLTAMQEMQLSQLWHTIVALILIAIILAHIYIGTLGMEGAFDAMGTGYVDENWAREHHNVWVAEVRGEPLPDPDEVHARHTQAAE